MYELTNIGCYLLLRRGANRRRPLVLTMPQPKKYNRANKYTNEGRTENSHYESTKAILSIMRVFPIKISR